MDFKYDRAKIDLVKSLKGRWSRSKKCWYVPDNTHFRTLFGMKIPPVGKGVLSKLSPVNARDLQRMKEVLQMKAYSPSTLPKVLNQKEVKRIFDVVRNRIQDVQLLNRLSFNNLMCFQ